jgi:hypothetical protein
MLWPSSPPPEEQPLFDGTARRRAIIKVLATTDVAASLSGDFIAGFTAGIRLRNFFEIGVVGREI